MKRQRSTQNKFNGMFNGMFNEIQTLITKEGEETVNILTNSAYHTQGKVESLSKEYTNIFKYPIIHSVSVKNEPVFIYSNTNQNGHFGIPKVIFGRRACGSIIDENGEFGCSQDTSSIIDDPKNLKYINACLQSQKFIKLMSYCNFNSTAADRYNKNVLSLFRKDFWKSFVDADGNEI